jgi:hypothetical protein
MIIGFTPLAFSTRLAAIRRFSAAASLPLLYEVVERAGTLVPPIPEGKRIPKTRRRAGGPTGAFRRQAFVVSIGNAPRELENL